MAAEFRAHELLLRAHDTLASGDLIKRPFQASLIACDERDVTPLQRDIAEWLRRCEAEPGQALVEFVTEILTGPGATSDAERIAGLATALKAIDAAIENVLPVARLLDASLSLDNPAAPADVELGGPRNPEGQIDSKV
jgi:hypothetical protein